MMKAARRAVESGAGTIVVGGGDGTISAVVNLLANRPELTLGILPVGTGNEVARILQIPLDLPGACRVIASGRTEAVDLAEANGKYFLHTALVGYPAHVNHTMPSGLKARFGKPAYTFSLLRAMIGSRPFHARVTGGETTWEGETIAVIAGNGRFHLPGRVLLPRRGGKEPGLVVYTPRGSSLSTLFRLAVGLWITRTKQPDLLFSVRGNSITVETDPPQDVDLDGEYHRQTPVNFQLSRAALRVLVPGE
jgi:YegS/Rv2252/BmrU family lipid kinase